MLHELVWLPKTTKNNGNKGNTSTQQQQEKTKMFECVGRWSALESGGSVLSRVNYRSACLTLK